MARNETEAGDWHVWARGVERRPIFLDDEDRRTYLRLLASVVVTFRWHCLAYCLMNNHVHLVIETREPNLGRGMHSLHGLYAQYFNVKYARAGHLFQDRYGSRVIHDEYQLAVVLAYVACNPVAGGLCERAEDYEWGSYRAVAESRRSPIVDARRLGERLSPFGDRVEDCYASFVEARLLNCEPPAPS